MIILPNKASIISCIVSVSPPCCVFILNSVSKEYSIISQTDANPIAKKKSSITINNLLVKLLISTILIILKPILIVIKPDQKCKKSS